MKKIYTTANPCKINPHARECDFWIGEWDVYLTGTTNFAGNSIVQCNQDVFISAKEHKLLK